MAPKPEGRWPSAIQIVEPFCPVPINGVTSVPGTVILFGLGRPLCHQKFEQLQGEGGYDEAVGKFVPVLGSLPGLYMEGDTLSTEEIMAKRNLIILLQQEIGLKLLM